MNQMSEMKRIADELEARIRKIQVNVEEAERRVKGEPERNDDRDSIEDLPPKPTQTEWRDDEGGVYVLTGRFEYPKAGQRFVSYNSSSVMLIGYGQHCVANDGKRWTLKKVEPWKPTKAWLAANGFELDCGLQPRIAEIGETVYGVSKYYDCNWYIRTGAFRDHGFHGYRYILRTAKRQPTDAEMLDWLDGKVAIAIAYHGKCLRTFRSNGDNSIREQIRKAMQ